MNETTLIIGDVHGCFHTFHTLVERYWKPETMRLVQLGDLTDRGRYIPETIAFARGLEREYPEQTVFLKGNHEAMVLELWTMMQRISPVLAKIYSYENSTLMQYLTRSAAREHLVENVGEDMDWLSERPLFWENDVLFVSHAGVSQQWEIPSEALQENDPESILWTRSTLKNIGKMQVVGHTPIESGTAQFREAENCWNIDTGAVFGLNLTALHVSHEGTVLDIFSLPTQRIDYKRP
jgi:serine/threonine protein phosphatase 1